MRIAFVLTLIALGCVLVGAVVLQSGMYNIAATEQHYAPTYLLLDTGMRRSVQSHARGIDIPPLDDPALVDRGLTLYRAHCAQCHGAPGIAPEPFALGLTPPPANLAHAARAWRANELYWIVRNGAKMTGMPAWEFRLSEHDTWAVVAFMLELPRLSPFQYAAKTRGTGTGDTAVPVTTREAPPTSPSEIRGKRALLQYGCGTCHAIPGIVGAYAQVGPPLKGLATRPFLAGILTNTPENLLRWIQHPTRIDPNTAMPDLGVPEGDARDIAAYLSNMR